MEGRGVSLVQRKENPMSPRTLTCFTLSLVAACSGAPQLPEEAPTDGEALAADEAGETFVDDAADEKADGIGQTCQSSASVYAETLPDTDASAADLKLVTLSLPSGLPAGVGRSETRQTFRSAAALSAVFGAAAPTVDFSTHWVFFYSAGAQVPAGSVARVVRVRQRSASLRVTTALQRPAAACAVPAAVPYVLVKFPRPALSRCRVSYYHRTDAGDCPPPPDPTPRCDGTLTPAAALELERKLPRATFANPSFYATTRNAVNLGPYQIGVYRRRCEDVGRCATWTALPPGSLLDYYRVGRLAYDREGGRLIGMSFMWTIDFYAGSQTYYGDCNRWADGEGAVTLGAGAASAGPLSLIDQGTCRRAQSSAGASFKPIKDDAGVVDQLRGVLTDHCALLSRTVKAPLSGAAFEETMTTLSTSWTLP